MKPDRTPRVVYLGDSAGGAARFRIVGGSLANGWTAREGKEAWCEVTVHADGHVGAFGGEVWPSAWPLLFESLPSTAAEGSARVRATAAGREALDAALVRGMSGR